MPELSVTRLVWMTPAQWVRVVSGQALARAARLRPHPLSHGALYLPEARLVGAVTIRPPAVGFSRQGRGEDAARMIISEMTA